MFARRFLRAPILAAPLHQACRPRPNPTQFATAFQQPRPRYYNGGRSKYTYQRFGGGAARSQNVWQRWASSPNFYYQVAGVGVVAGGFYIYNLETVPVSGRRRFNIVSPELELEISKDFYKQVMQEFQHQILPPWDSRVRMVRRVLDRLIPASGLTNVEWEVNVIDSEEQNAFVIPGGKVFVFSGMLPMCKNEDGVAAVLGHEIAHNVARHTAEKISESPFIWFIGLALAVTVGLPMSVTNSAIELGFSRPGSRKQEAEADFIGLMMMAQACYNPEAAVEMWARMDKADQHQPPQFLSTHPSHGNREEKIREWLPRAHEKLEMSECHGLSSYADEFRRSFGVRSW